MALGWVGRRCRSKVERDDEAAARPLSALGREHAGPAEGINTRIEVLERMAYGIRSRANYTARVLLVCSGHPPALSPP